MNEALRTVIRFITDIPYFMDYTSGRTLIQDTDGGAEREARTKQRDEAVKRRRIA